MDGISLVFKMMDLVKEYAEFLKTSEIIDNQKSEPIQEIRHLHKNNVLQNLIFFGRHLIFHLPDFVSRNPNGENASTGPLKL